MVTKVKVIIHCKLVHPCDIFPLRPTSMNLRGFLRKCILIPVMVFSNTPILKAIQEQNHFRHLLDFSKECIPTKYSCDSNRAHMNMLGKNLLKRYEKLFS